MGTIISPNKVLLTWREVVELQGRQSILAGLFWCHLRVIAGQQPLYEVVALLSISKGGTWLHHGPDIYYRPFEEDSPSTDPELSLLKPFQVSTHGEAIVCEGLDTSAYDYFPAQI